MSEHFYAFHFFHSVADVGRARRCRLHPRLVEFAGQALDLSVFLFQFKLQRFCGRGSVRARGDAGDHAFQLMILAEVFERPLARHRLHAAHS